MTLRILFVCDYYPPHVGGAELVYKRYCEGLVERGHSVKVITIKHSMDLPNEEVLNGVEIQRVITPSNSRYLFIFYSGREILSSARDVDIVHCAFFMAPFPSFPVAKLWRKPLVVTVHEVWGKMWFKFERNFLRAFINYSGEKLLMHVPYDAITCCSLYTLNSLRLFGVRNDLITYIPNGAELDLFSPRSADHNLKRKLGLDDSKIYMYYGRPGISKGVYILIKAAALVKKRFRKSS